MTSNEAPGISKRQLGRTAALVTELGLGTAPLGDLWDIVEEEEAGALLGEAWNGGVRYFDTSPCTERDRRSIAWGALFIEGRAISL